MYGDVTISCLRQSHSLRCLNIILFRVTLTSVLMTSFFFVSVSTVISFFDQGIWVLLYVVQHTSVSPDSKTVVVVGDNADGLLADSQSGKVCFKHLHASSLPSVVSTVTQLHVIGLFGILIYLLKYMVCTNFAGYSNFKGAPRLLICVSLAPGWLCICNWKPRHYMPHMG